MPDVTFTEYLMCCTRWLENQCKAVSLDHSGRRVVESDLDAARNTLRLVLDRDLVPADCCHSDDAKAVRRLAYWLAELVELIGEQYLRDRDGT
jgi:hypothetical protein